MFAASGFDAKRDIAGMVLNRFGHAFINPQPGFFLVSTVNQPPVMHSAMVPLAESPSRTAI